MSRDGFDLSTCTCSQGGTKLTTILGHLIIFQFETCIQDFEMGGEFSLPQSEKSEKSNIISIFEG